MVTTLLDVRNRIQDDIDRTDLTSQVTDFVNRAIKFYEKENFWFTETSTTFVTVAGTETYTLSAIATNIKNIIRVEIQESSNQIYELNLRDINYIRNQNTGTTNNGKPTDYCLYAGSLYLSRIPDAVYTIRVFYRKDYPALVNTSDTNDKINTLKAELLTAQAAFDNATNSEGMFVFDEIGLRSFSQDGAGQGELLTHVIFHPVQKSLNRMIQIDYTVRIQSLTNGI
jgi:hypothetical protein